jgi:hypothetical protein
MGVNGDRRNKKRRGSINGINNIKLNLYNIGDSNKRGDGFLSRIIESGKIVAKR